MQAVISLRDALHREPLLPIAGRPLLARQIQWLIDAGFEHIAVEFDTHPQSDAAAQWLTNDILGSRVRHVLTATPLDPLELIARAGFDGARPFLVVPADVISDTNLVDVMCMSPATDVLVHLEPPTTLHASAPQLRSGSLRVLRPGATEQVTEHGTGWGASVGRLDEALALGIAALSHSLPGVLVHAAELEPGVWIARGADVSPEALLRGPLFIGSDTVVRGGAILGPGAQLGANVVVERGASIHSAWIADGTTVGEGVALERCAVIAGKVVLLEGAMVPLSLGDSLLLEGTAEWSVPWLDRVVSVTLLLLLSPAAALGWCVSRLRGRPFVSEYRRDSPTNAPTLHDGNSGLRVCDINPSLWDVLIGRRTLIGVGPRAIDHPGSQGLRLAAAAAPCGAFTIDNALCPPDSDGPTRLRAIAWYAHERSRWLDLKLLLRALLASNTTPSPSGPSPPPPPAVATP